MDKISSESARAESKLGAISSYCCAILSGLLLAAPYLVPSTSLIAFVALIPWQHAVRLAKTKWRVVMLTLLFGTTASGLALHWFIYPLIELHQDSKVIASTLVLGLAFVNLLFVVPFALFDFYLSQDSKRIQSLGYLVWLSFLYASLEHFYPKLFTDTIALASFGSVEIRQVLSIVGRLGLSALIVFSNLTLSGALYALRNRKPVNPFPLVLLMLALTTAFAFGRWRTASLLDVDSEPIRFTIVQGNPEHALKNRALKGDLASQFISSENYVDISREALAHYPTTQILVWPETAYTHPFRHLTSRELISLDRQVEDLSRDHDLTLAFGAPNVDPRTQTIYNALAF